ncbi:MAG: methyltransferase domain-containing protein [Elusimicrobia bacterium]|nr:methyltransferase domain-containing protein [Elusimicrobiota bacterium]
MTKNNLFDDLFFRYDEWFEKHKFAYRTEVELLKKLVPSSGRGLEIGVGTGRFAEALGIKEGADISEKMLELAARRGVAATLAAAENLPYEKESFDFVLLMMTICFTDDPSQALKEAGRILKPGGFIIAGIIDKNSSMGKGYRGKDSPFYKSATFFSAEELLHMLTEAGFGNFEVLQTLFENYKDSTGLDRIDEGYGSGSFVAVKAEKIT